MDILLEQFSKKIGRGDFAIRYFAAAIVLSFLVMWEWSSDYQGALYLVNYLIILYALLLSIQRVNDIGWSRWFVLITMLPIVNLVLFFRKGNTVSTTTPTHKPSKWFVEIPTGETKNIPDKIVAAVAKPHEKTNALVEHSDVKYCRHCGTKHMKDARFCSSCGKPFL